MSTTTLPDPRRYFEAVAAERRDVAEAPPVCLYLEVTNRCNLLCETCPRTFEDLEPPADMSWSLFTRIVDQVPNVARVVLHGVGEPMLVKHLPKMIRYLKDRGTRRNFRRSSIPAWTSCGSPSMRRIAQATPPFAARTFSPASSATLVNSPRINSRWASPARVFRCG
jgi:organic radical activating enzyme